MLNVSQAKRKLKKDGWSYRRAALVLGCSYSWLSRVLNGYQTSDPLLAAIESLPTFAQWRQAHEQN